MCLDPVIKKIEFIIIVAIFILHTAWCELTVFAGKNDALFYMGTFEEKGGGNTWFSINLIFFFLSGFVVENMGMSYALLCYQSALIMKVIGL